MRSATTRRCSAWPRCATPTTRRCSITAGASRRSSRSSGSTSSRPSADASSTAPSGAGFVEIDRVVAIKVAPFDRYRTLDVVRALAESGRADVALYTGNDDTIVADLLTPFPAGDDGRRRALLGRPARPLGGVDAERGRSAEPVSGDHARVSHRRRLLTNRCSCSRSAPSSPTSTRRCSTRPTSSPAASPGIHEVLRRQGLLAGRWCLDPHEELSPGQMAAIDRVLARYPHLADDDFVREHLDRWMG